MDDPSPNSLELFEAIYETALFPAHFDDLVQAWDRTFNHQNASEEAPAKLAELEAQGIHRHFFRAGQIFAATDARQSKDLDQFIESQRTASMLTEAGGRVLASNSAATRAFGVAAGDDIRALPLEAHSGSRVRAAMSKLASHSNGRENAVALSGVRQDNGKVFIVVVERMATDTFSGLMGPLFLIRSTLSRWDEQISQLLQSAFELTAAELEIIELLNDGLRLDEIAQHRGRSEKTVRTQLRNINTKTRTNSQIELMRHVSSLIIMAGELHETSSLSVERSLDSELESTALSEGFVRTPDGRDIHYVDQSSAEATRAIDVNDSAVLCFFPTMPPLQQTAYESSLQKAGLRRVAVYKPGAGGSTAVQEPQTPRQQADDLYHVAAHLGLNKIVVFGCCAGGIAALHFATEHPTLVNGAVLLDTGAPLQHQYQWDAMAEAASRTFFLAKHSPELLETPHKLVAANFASGPEGKQQTVNYFYAGQGEDLALLQDTHRYEWACAMLEYCLSHTEQLIQDVRSWSSDWSELVTQVATDCPIVFVHGDVNEQFPITDVEQFCKEHHNCNFVPAAGAAQLTLLTHSDLLVGVLCDLARRGTE